MRPANWAAGSGIFICRAATSPNALSPAGWRAERAQGSNRGGEFGQRVGFAQLRSSYLLHGRIKCRSAAIAGAPLGGATDMVVRLIGRHAMNDLKRRPELSKFSKPHATRCAPQPGVRILGQMDIRVAILGSVLTATVAPLIGHTGA